MNIFERLTAQPIRRTDDGYLGGICAGLSHRWDISPILLRLAAIILAFFAGIGIIAYGLAWLLLPHDPDNRIELEEVVEGRLSGGFAASLAMLVIGIWVFFEELAHQHWLFYSRFTGSLLIVAVIMTTVVIILRKKHDTHPATVPAHSFATHDQADDASIATPSSFEQKTEPQPRPQLRPRTPAVSGAFILITLALSASAAAVTLLVTPRTISSVLLALGIPLTILGVSIILAGVRGKRSTWLSFIATLLVFPVVTLIPISFLIPQAIMDNDKLKFFAETDRTGSAGVIDHHKHSTTHLTDKSSISAVFTDSKYVLDRNDPVILDITLTGTITMDDMGGWKVHDHNGETYITPTPEIHSERNGDRFGDPQPDTPIEPDEWYVIPNETVINRSSTPKSHITITSPAAQQDPKSARRITITYAVGDVRLSETLNGQDAVTFIARQRGIPINSDTPALEIAPAQSEN
ncbi:PspC domain-containing protein [Arcanobacterium phocae]|uniref:PspC domain-containing protein n=1 Tax=Arcanobacterium phocae TaxID=131112 RepID=UPI001C0F3421|nr:PspC domain-containing protein [Arcanobacterium phocae]